MDVFNALRMFTPYYHSYIPDFTPTMTPPPIVFYELLCRDISFVIF